MWHSYLHSCGSCFCGFSSSHMKMFQIICCSICLAQLFSLYLYSPITINHKSNQNNSYSTHGWGSSILSSPSTKWVDWRESYKVLSFKSSKKYLSLLEIGSPAKFQPVPFSSLHLFFFRKQRIWVYIFWSGMYKLSSCAQSCLQRLKKQKASEILTAVQIYPGQPWKGWAVLVKEIESSYLCILICLLIC